MEGLHMQLLYYIDPWPQPTVTVDVVEQTQLFALPSSSAHLQLPEPLLLLLC